MSTPKDEPIKSPTSGGGAESPTTVRPLDMDDDEVPDTPALSGGDAPTTTTSQSATYPPKPTVEDDEAPAPAKPPRPLSPQQQAMNTLREAFPSIDAKVVQAVLVASGGRVEPAFNALLGMTDPAAAEAVPPPQPPRPRPGAGAPAQLSQVEADELYARQLAEHYDGSYRQRQQGQQGYRGPPQQPPRRRDSDEQEYSFIDDDLPVIKESLKKGFLETQTKVNGWIATFKKKLDGEEEGGLGFGGSSGGAGGSASRPNARRSGDYNRYDADPQVLGDDFASMQLHHEDAGPRQRSTRPLANPDLFKPVPRTPSEGRKVSFQNPQEDSDLYRTSPKITSRDTSAAKPSKWQPLSNVEPSPVGEGEHDPFSLGDSEDERETKSKEIKMEESDSVKKATAEAMADTIGTPSKAGATAEAKDKPTS